MEQPQKLLFHHSIYIQTEGWTWARYCKNLYEILVQNSSASTVQPPTCTEVRLCTLSVCYCLGSRKAYSSSCLFPPLNGTVEGQLVTGTSSHMVSLGLPRMTENTGSEQWERLNNHLPHSSDLTQEGLRHAKEQHFTQKVSFCQLEIWCTHFM